MHATEPDLSALDDKSFVDDGDGTPLPAEGSIEADPAFARPDETKEANDLSAFDDLSFSDGDEEDETAVVAVETRYAAEVNTVVAQPQPTTAVRESAANYSITSLHPHGPLNVVMHRNGDARSDVAKLEAALQTLRKYEGQQPFTITLTSSIGQGSSSNGSGGGRPMTLDFPNDTTRDCAELRAELTALLGAKCVV